MSASAESGDEGYLEVLDASSVLDELTDAARVEAWASSVLGVWAEDPQAGEIDLDFVDWLRSSADPRAPLVLLAVSDLLDIDDAAVGAARERLSDTPSWFPHLGSAQPTRAWTVDQDRVRSVGIGFVLSDNSEHSLLGDIIDGELGSLIVAPGPTELFDGAEDLVDPQPEPVVDAAGQIVQAWRAIAGAAELPDSIYVNGGIARARLARLTGEDLAELVHPAIDTAPQEGDPTERAELDAWALAQLDMAGLGTGAAGPELLLDAIDPGRIATYPAAEREAFAALEWADWLGMVIGLSRGAAEIEVTPAMLIDQINRCPEVTSTIPKKDRPYFEWAVSLLLPLWRRARVIDERSRLTDNGAEWLVDAVRTAWAKG